MTYRDKLIESLTKAGFQRSYNANIFDKDLDDEEVSIRVLFNDYADFYAEVYMSFEGKTIGNLYFTTNCLYACGIEERAKKFGEICRKAVL